MSAAKRLAALLLLAVLGLGMASPGAAQRAAESGAPLIARVRASPEQAQRLAQLGVDLLEARDGPDLFILTSAEQVAWLQAQGWQVALDPAQTQLARQAQAAGAPAGYRTLDEIQAALDAAVLSYPDLASPLVYGTSHEGRPLFGIRLTNRQRPGPKPIFVLLAAIHAREIVTPELALRLVNYLLSSYGRAGDATWLLDEQEIIVLPVLNPDGYLLAQQGLFQRKNRNLSYGGDCSAPLTPYENHHGVDLNRNFSFKWGLVGSSADPCSQIFAGAQPGPEPSEPESRALEQLLRQTFADQRGPLDGDAAPPSTSGIVITLHSFGNLVLWPWGYTISDAPNGAALARIGLRLAGYMGYNAGQPGEVLYRTAGTNDDWIYGELGVAAFTFEVGPPSGGCSGFMPAYSCLDSGPGFWPQNLPALLYAARIARAPYQLAEGPAPALIRASAVSTSSLLLQASFDEQLNGGQPIAAVEYYVDVPPWSGGSPQPLAPQDGRFDSPIEVATGRLELAPGRHLIYVRAMDAAGNWGPAGATLVELPQRLVWLPLQSR